ncbi:hypothetical protein RRG08_039136 [Elysia crispata]|uniref:Apple domain-containing protein n=1 Tax=Elysia crispata TaxID=231223 RepID=A0AAE1D211_9GAST|nr:hypothetical protein RRG08_039136 [Elysia crispata]
MFDFHFRNAAHNSTTHEMLCKEMGYDGLAVISAPEAYHYTIHVTEYHRSVTSRGFYLGIHYRPELVINLWDDDTVIRSDTPFGSTKPRAHMPYGRLHDDTRIVMTSGAATKSAICGNHKNYPTESRGTTLRGELQTLQKTVLSVSQVFSYLECAVICGTVHECRAAEFNSDLLTCTVIGEYTSTGSIANPQIETYMRITF